MLSHLFANLVRYEIPKGASLHKGVSGSINSVLLGKQPKVQDRVGSYMNVVKGNNLPPEKILKHEGVASWFNNLGNAQEDFISKERIVWVDMEGVPTHAWTLGTFKEIRSKWGEVIEIEEYNDGLFARKRICIKTRQEDNILEKFKIIVKGKVFVIRAKELFMWSSVFKVDNEAKLYSEEGSSTDSGTANGDNINNAKSDLDSDNDAVSYTFYGENMENLDKDNSYNHPHSVNVPSPDPFNIHELLRKNAAGVHNISSESISFPPGFSPVDNISIGNEQDAKVSRSDFNHVCINEHMSSK
nr:RNA-directed DNA polymerase, eukaryota [Tanacetum cinerariifolium]